MFGRAHKVNLEKGKRKMKIKLSKVRLSFPALFKPKAYDKSGSTDQTKRYQADLMIDKKDKAQIDAVTKAINSGLKEVFGDKAATMLKAFKANPQKFCFHDGDEKLNKQGEPVAPGYFVLCARRREMDGPPGVFDSKAGADGRPAKLSDNGRVYAGCKVNASVDIWVQEGQYAGVRCALRGVQFAEDGEPFAGSPAASADEFESLADEADMASAELGDDLGDDFAA